MQSGARSSPERRNPKQTLRIVTHACSPIRRNLGTLQALSSSRRRPMNAGTLEHLLPSLYVEVVVVALDIDHQSRKAFEIDHCSPAAARPVS